MPIVALFLFFNGFVDICISINLYYSLQDDINSSHILITSLRRSRRSRRSRRRSQDIIITRGAYIIDLPPQIDYNWKKKLVFINEEIKCNICLETQPQCISFTNCTHKLCKDCTLSLEKNECPYCRKVIIEVIAE